MADSFAADPNPTFAEFASGLWHARCVGDVTHLIFYIDEIDPPEIGHHISPRLTRRIVLTNAAVDRMIRILQTAREQPASSPAPRLVPEAGHH